MSVRWYPNPLGGPSLHGTQDVYHCSLIPDVRAGPHLSLVKSQQLLRPKCLLVLKRRDSPWDVVLAMLWVSLHGGEILNDREASSLEGE